MQEEIENKSVTLIINSSKLTARTLATAFMKFLQYSKGKLKEHHDVKPQGKQTVKELISQNQGVEKTELADKAEVRTFDHIAKQYGVDYAIKKGVSRRESSATCCFSRPVTEAPLTKPCPPMLPAM